MRVSVQPRDGPVHRTKHHRTKQLTKNLHRSTMPPMSQGFVLKNRVKAYRARLHMRQSDLARRVGVARQTIIAIEKGRLNPSILISLRIARALHEPVEHVFFLVRQASGVEKDQHAVLVGLAPEEPRAVCSFP